MSENVSYLIAKVEAMHEDIKLLTEQVDELRQESAGRRALNKFLLSSLGILGAILAWSIDKLITFTGKG